MHSPAALLRARAKASLTVIRAGLSMSTFTAVDLSRLPAPAVVEQLDFEVIFSAMLADLRARDPQFTAITESDPAYKLLQVCAYREMIVRQRCNEACRAIMLAY